MDLEGQDAIKRTVDDIGKEDVVVVLGTPTLESTQIFAETVTKGDPTWAGKLAGIALGLPVFHVTEPEIKALVDPAVFDKEVGPMEYVLDVETIGKVLREIRDGSD